MTSPQLMAAAVRTLMKKAELSDEEVAQRLALLQDRDYWRRLAPSAAIEGDAYGATFGNGTSPDPVRVPADARQRETKRIAQDGYFRMEGVVEMKRVARMRRTIEAVRAAKWPAVFAFLFDDFWSIAQSQSLLDFVDATLGPGCLRNTVVWAHWVEGEAGQSGWSPHTDDAALGGALLSVWIALSDATLDNGCMSLVRAGAVPRDTADAIDRHMDLNDGAVRRLLQNVVALPVKAGSIIGWRGDVLHWGGTNTGDSSPRISFALEFRRRDAKATKFEAPLIDPREGPPPFDLRLYAISKALREYPKFEPMIERYRGLADRLWERTKPT